MLCEEMTDTIELESPSKFLPSGEQIWWEVFWYRRLENTGQTREDALEYLNQLPGRRAPAHARS